MIRPAHGDSYSETVNYGITGDGRRGSAQSAVPGHDGEVADWDETTELCVDVRRGGPPLVKVRGDIDIASCPWLREELLRVIGQHGARLVLDLSGVTFMDCAGINLLLATRRRAQLEGGWLRVAEASRRVRRIIALAGLEEMFATGAITGEANGYV